MPTPRGSYSPYHPPSRSHILGATRRRRLENPRTATLVAQQPLSSLHMVDEGRALSTRLTSSRLEYQDLSHVISSMPDPGSVPGKSPYPTASPALSTRAMCHHVLSAATHDPAESADMGGNIDAIQLLMRAHSRDRSSPTAARAAGGESPLLEAHSGVIHPRTNSAARMAGWRLPHPGCTQAPRASGDTRLDSRACLTPRTPHICRPSLPLSLAPQGRWQIEKLRGPPMCAVLARNALSRQMHTGLSFFPPVMPHIMARTRSAHFTGTHILTGTRATTDAYAARVALLPVPQMTPYI